MTAPKDPPPSSRTATILLAAGASRRLAGDEPKTLRPLAGRPLYRWALNAALACEAVDDVVLVVPTDALSRVEAELAADPDPRVRTVSGGQTRGDSVRAGLAALHDDTRWVLVHDAARPFVTATLFLRVLAEAHRGGAATAALEVVDALRYREPDDAATAYLERSAIARIQTPQAFRRDRLEGAHDAADDDARRRAPDDAALVAAMGHPVTLVQGDAENLKITVVADLQRAERRLEGTRPAPRPRVGTGWDIHRLVGGRPLWLAGVVIPGPRGLAGHSDGDVASHAIADALLGATGLGDLGDHFPPSDPRWAGVSGAQLLGEIAALLRRHGTAICNVDVTIIAERPALQPHRNDMRFALARALSVGADQVSVKATTAEGLGPMGATAAIAAQAVALVESIP